MSEWDSFAAAWDDDPGARNYAQAAFSSLTDVLQGVDVSLVDANVLDFGCGTGLLTERLVAGGAMVMAVDTSPAMLEVLDAKIIAHGWGDVTTASVVPDNPAAFDLVVCSSVCSFLGDYPGTVTELVKLLTPGGLFVQWDWELDDTDDDPHGLSRSQIIKALESAGLKHITVDIGFDIPYQDQTMRPLMGWGRRPDHLA